MVVVASKSLLFVKGQIDVSSLCVTGSLVEVLKVLDLLAFVNQECRNHYGTGIYHWIVRSAMLIKHWCIKNLTTWLFTNVLMHISSTAFLNIEVVKICVGNNFADRLHRKLSSKVTQLSKLTIN
jgi:hypothetical protein